MKLNHAKWMYPGYDKASGVLSGEAVRVGTDIPVEIIHTTTPGRGKNRTVRHFIQTIKTPGYGEFSKRTFYGWVDSSDLSIADVFNKNPVRPLRQQRDISADWIKTYQLGQRVQISPAYDAWMRGDRYGEVVKLGSKALHIKLDKSGRILRVNRPSGIYETIGSNPAPRIGTRKRLRASQATGKKPTRRLIRRRSANTRKGYYPNPSSGVRIVHNKLLGGWYIVRGPHHTPIGGRFNSKAEAQQHLRNQQAARDARAPTYKRTGYAYDPRLKSGYRRTGDYAPHPFTPDPDEGATGECSVCGTGIDSHYHHNPIPQAADGRYVVQVENNGKWETVASFRHKDQAVAYARIVANKSRKRHRIMDRT